MTAQEYLTDQIKNTGAYRLTAADRAVIDAQGIEAYIYGKLTSKKFRKWALDADSQRQVQGAIHIAVTADQPIQFRYPFGGYKLWRLPTAPRVDWAEFFAVAYYLHYLAPIAAAYAPGAELIFSSDDIIVERMDNIPVADTDAYFASFRELLGAFRAHLPANLKIDIIRVADLYPDKAEFEAELAANLVPAAAGLAALEPEKLQPKLATSELNVNPSGAKKLSDQELQEYIARGQVYHDGYGAASKRQAFVRGDDKIVLFTVAIRNAIAIGTTKSSVTKFWTGIGVLEPSGDTYQARVLSPSRASTAELHWQDVNIGLDNPNFTRIGVL